ncbi:EamA family transporter RarD [Alteromonadaceae bacterium BrNp21-10]|nr:EamA family transporter RarD [Alteromonadaceae bacterium BrNp21-10]
MQDKSVKIGVLLAIAAYSMWGVAPIYFKAISHISAPDILMHRVVWSAVVLFVLVLALGQVAKVRAAMKNIKVLQTLLITGVLLAANWLLFIWAINNGHILEASLGYYINPLLNVLLGYLFLGERLRRLQQLAVVLALVGVAFLVISLGQLPWIALILAFSFGIYGLLRKTVAVDSLPGLTIETTMMLPFALLYWVFFASADSNMLLNDISVNTLLVFAGVVTTAPLLCFTGAAKRLMFSTLGFFQYIGPSLMFVLAVYLYNEPLQIERLITFAFVWMALFVFSMDSLRHYRQQRKLRLSAQTATLL